MIIQTAAGALRPIGDDIPRKTWRTGAGYSEAQPRTPTYPPAGAQGGPCAPSADALTRTLAGRAVP